MQGIIIMPRQNGNGVINEREFDINEREFDHVRHEAFGKEFVDIWDAVRGVAREGFDLLQIWNLGEKVKVKTRDGKTVTRSRWNHDLREFGGAAFRLYKEINDLGPLALGAYLLLAGGSAVAVSGAAKASTFLVDPYSINDVRVLESNVDERPIEGKMFYRWTFDGVDDKGKRVTRTMHFVSEEAATKAGNVGYNDTVGLPAGGVRSWLAEAIESQGSTDKRYAGSMSVSPSVYEGRIKPSSVPASYSKGRGRLTVTAMADGNERVLTYVGDQSTVEAAVKMLKGLKGPVRLNTNGHAGTLVATLGDNYAR